MRFQTVHTPTSLTEGPISQALISFALPLLLGNLFQQLYNTADSLIVGNFLGSEALAAVSSSGNLIFLMVGLVNGISMGAGVVIARYFGAKDYDRMQKTIHTLLAFGLVAGALLTIVGIVLSPVMLRLMDTPETVLPNSISYFRTYFTGSLAFVLYNICMGVLQAVGDSRHPLQISDDFFPRQRRARPDLCRCVPHGRVVRRRGDGHFPVGEHGAVPAPPDAKRTRVPRQPAENPL